jgi:hypothetical protein
MESLKPNSTSSNMMTLVKERLSKRKSASQWKLLQNDSMNAKKEQFDLPQTPLHPH